MLNKLLYSAAATAAILFTYGSAHAQSPTNPAQGFNVFTENGLTVTTNETDGPVACGGDFTIKGNYQIATNSAGNYMVNNVKIGLLIGGKVNYTSGNQVQVNQNAYIKIGNSAGSYVWYYDQNNAASPIRITPSSSYDSSPKIMLQANSNQLGVGVNNNPVFQSNLIDFASAFTTMRTKSSSISQCTGNAQLTNPNGQSIPTTNLPNQVKINLQDGINYLNVTGADMNNVQVFTYNNQPSASKILVINVNAPGTFNWNVWNQAGVGFQNCPYIIYNFYNTTQLNINGSSTVEGTIFAPFADVNKTINQSNVEGQVISKSFTHSGGEVHYAIFSPTVNGCAAAPGVAPTANFTTNNSGQCLATNSFTFTNTSNTGSAVQPEAPMTYSWNFGDGTTSTAMSPTKTYTTAGTYTVTLTTTNTYGSSTKTATVTVYGTTNATVTQTTTSSGNGSITKQFTLTNASAYTSYSWTTPQGSGLSANQQSINVTFTQAGYYEVKVVSTNDNGCQNTTIVPVVIASSDVNTGNDGGLESESLGDAVTKRYVHRKMNSVPTKLVKSEATRFNKGNLVLANPNARTAAGLTLLEMFPSQLEAGNTANITSPTDILDYTVAEEVLSVDFSIGDNTKAVVLGVRTSDKVYNHTKASCDRLRGAEIMNVKTVQVSGYNFLMQAIKQRNGVTEYAISFAVGKDAGASNYSIQTNWFVKEYTASNDVYNFQVWATVPENTTKLVADILAILNADMPVNQTEVQKLPKTYAAKVSREGTDLVLKLRSTEVEKSVEVSMEEVYTETNGFALRYNPIKSETEQIVRLDIKDGYEYDGLIKVEGDTQDAFYHADGNWGLDYDTRYTTVNTYEVSNDFNRVYESDEYAVNRNVELKAHSEYDYLTLYKSLLPGNLSADYSEYGYLAFTATGSGSLELGLVKSSVEEWKHQYRAVVNVGEDEKTYYVPFSFFTSTKSTDKLNANDLTTVTFTFLPVDAGTTNLNLKVKDVKFTKSAPAGFEELLVNMKNEFLVYPNPSQGDVNCLLYSDAATTATITLTDITGKTVYNAPVNLTEGRNELQFNFNLPAKGLMFMTIANEKTNFGTSKIVFK